MHDGVEITLKLIVVGNGQVGKTSMITRFVTGQFVSDYKKTLAVDFLEKSIDLINDQIIFHLWDTAGQEEYDSLTRSYYSGAGAAVIAFSMTDRASFIAVPSWVRKVKSECSEVPIVLVQNKVSPGLVPLTP